MAAIGLGATAISTYYGARVSKDQLYQSQEDAADKSKAQASRVSIWDELSKHHGRSIVLANRSLDTVSISSLKFLAFGFTDKGKEIEEAYSIHFGAMPPCTKFTIEPQMVSRDSVRHLPDDTLLDVSLILFSDANGQSWGRSSSGQLSKIEWGESDLEIPSAFRRSEKVLSPPQENLMQLKGEPLEDCTPDK